MPTFHIESICHSTFSPLYPFLCISFSICRKFPAVVVFGTSPEALQQAMLRLLRGGAELSPKLLCLALEGLKTWPGGSGGCAAAPISRIMAATGNGTSLHADDTRNTEEYGEFCSHELRPKDLLNPKLLEELVNAAERWQNRKWRATFVGRICEFHQQQYG